MDAELDGDVGHEKTYVYLLYSMGAMVRWLRIHKCFTILFSAQ